MKLRRRLENRLNKLCVHLMCLCLYYLFSVSPHVQAGETGFCYGRFANNLPSPDDVAQFLVKQSIHKIRIFDNDQTVIQAFANTNIDLVIGIPTSDLPDFQTEDQADAWVNSSLVAFVPTVSISAITVGSEVITNNPSSAPLVLPAMKNIHTALTKANLASTIQVTTANSMAVLENSFPPSSAIFNHSFSVSFMKPLLDYLHAIGSAFMINAYPYLAYTIDSARVPLDYALFHGQEPVVDPNTNLQYTSLFDAQLDALYFAMEALGHSELQIMVSETGWPTKGDPDEPGATVQNAATYNNLLIERVVKGTGTPHRTNMPVDVYIFSLFNENMKGGAESERHWGVFNADESSVYGLDLTGKNLSSSDVQAPNASPGAVSNRGTTSSNRGKVGGGVWCIAKPGESNVSLADGINWACGKGKIDCTEIQQGQACYEPDTFQNHASFAFNSYFEKNGGNAASCDFNGSATVTTIDPSYGSCNFPSIASAMSPSPSGNASSMAAHSILLCRGFVAIPLMLLLLPHLA